LEWGKTGLFLILNISISEKARPPKFQGKMKDEQRRNLHEKDCIPAIPWNKRDRKGYN